MPVYDKRSDGGSYESGTDLLERFVTAAEASDAAVSAFADSGEGWYTISYLTGGSWGPDREIEELKSESGHKIRDRVTSNLFVFENGVMQTDSATMKALTFFEDNAGRWRYFGATDPATPLEYQVVGFYSAKLAKNAWRIETSEGAAHIREIRVEASEDADGNLYEIEDVSTITDETGWPTELAGFKTDDALWPT